MATTVAAAIAMLRSQLNDTVAPYRHSDEAIARWLTDGQRLIAQLKTESYPVTALFVPENGTARQRLDPTVAYAFIRVENNVTLGA